jgi:hypothetical protein
VRRLTRTLGRLSLFRVAGATLALAWLVALIAFAYAATSLRPNAASIGAAVFALGIAAACFLYAWREPGP